MVSFLDSNVLVYYATTKAFYKLAVGVKDPAITGAED